MLGTWEQEAEVVLQGRNDEKHRSLAYYMLTDHHGQVQRGEHQVKSRPFPGRRR